MWSVFQDVISPRVFMPSPTAARAKGEAEVFPEELDAALAVRCMAAFLERMREESVAGIMVPIIQFLLWPAVPELGAEALDSLAKLSAAHALEDLAMAEAVHLERQLAWRQMLEMLPGQAYMPNPFRPAVLAMLDVHISGIGDGPRPQLQDLCTEDESAVSADMATWMLRECRASLYPELFQDTGLLPREVPARSVKKVIEVPSQMPSAKEGGTDASVFDRLSQFLQSARCM
ncbi:MKK3, partial [Symbiodinium pilosum]